MPPQKFKYDVPQELSLNAFTFDGHSFIGWATSADGDIVYVDGESVENLTETAGDTITLYAKWIIDGDDGNIHWEIVDSQTEPGKKSLILSKKED